MEGTFSMQKKCVILFSVLITLAMAAPAPGIAAAPDASCDDSDRICKEFKHLLETEHPEKIIAQYDPTLHYSEISLRYIGIAFLQLASKDDITPEQEEHYYMKALEVKQYSAYMGLYFFYADKDEEKALTFLREYAKTKPDDPVPYAILGKSELNRKHYDLADSYLREAKKVAHGYSPRVDWMLFQANYLLQHYQFASEMFESVVAQGGFDKEIKAMTRDPRFEGIEKRPEFERYHGMLNALKTSN
jgi:tetratricopeptide (TPR) repeat protein